MTPEEKQVHEVYRTSLIKIARDFVHSYIEKRAGDKIYYNNNTLDRKSAVIFRFSPPVKRGEKTHYFSQVVVNAETKECHLEYSRPINHENKLWYFPIFYVMNGLTKNTQRTFEKLSLTSVQTSLGDMFQKLGYRTFNRHFRSKTDQSQNCNIMGVIWGEPMIASTESTTTTTDQQQEAPAE